MFADEALAMLANEVGGFHITDRAMKRAQGEIEAALRAGSVSERQRRDYLAAVRRYFAGFEREARGHLNDVDRRLVHANQVVFNLTAERGVAVKRIEATRAVLHRVGELEHAAP
jgi:hypothetical protein